MPPADPSLRTRLAAFGLQYLVGKGYCGLLFLSRQVRGLENLPPGGKIIAPNHPNASDPFHMFAAFPGLLSLVQADILDVPFIGWTLKHSGQIPVDEPRKAEAYERGCRALEQGRAVMIFPEGVLNPDGKVLKAGTGPVRMSLETGAPILPFGIYVDPRNTLLIQTQPKNGKKPRVGRWQFRGRCFIQIDEPWSPAQERTGGVLPNLSELTELLMVRIRTAARQARENARVARPLRWVIPG
jgi:1-acyl-sn-glycerol-3-phosphate acyltransferase